MSDVQPEAEAQMSPDESAQVADAPMLDVDTTADRLTEIANQSLDSGEVARQIEELTSVVLDSAEVSTRSASIAADVSATMRAVVTKIQETNQRNVLHSRIMLGSFVACLVIAMAVFFGVTVKMTKSIKELDTMIYAMAKRVIEVDASLTAISKTHSDFAGLAEKQEEMTETQTRLASRLDEIGRSLSGMPVSMAEQSNKSTDPKFQLMMKQLQTMETRLGGVDAKMQAIESKAQTIDAKVQSMDARSQSVESKVGGIDTKLQSVSQAVSAKAQTPPGPSPQSVLQEMHKLKQELEASNQKTQQAAERALAKANEKADTAAVAASRAAAAEKAAMAERLANQRAAAEQAALERADPDRANRQAAQRAAAEKAAAEKAAAQKKAAADKAAAEKAAADKAAAEKAAADKAAADRAAAERAAERVRLLREQATQQQNATRLQYPRTPAGTDGN